MVVLVILAVVGVFVNAWLLDRCWRRLLAWGAEQRRCFADQEAVVNQAWAEARDPLWVHEFELFQRGEVRNR